MSIRRLLFQIQRSGPDKIVCRCSDAIPSELVSSIIHTHISGSSSSGSSKLVSSSDSSKSVFAVTGKNLSSLKEDYYTILMEDIYTKHRYIPLDQRAGKKEEWKTSIRQYENSFLPFIFSRNNCDRKINMTEYQSILILIYYFRQTFIFLLHFN